MTTQGDIAKLIAQSQAHQRCAEGVTCTEQRVLCKWVARGTLHRPYPNLYIDAAYWATLTQREQTMHVIRSLAQRHPEWVFAQLSAACVLDYEYPLSLHDGSITIVVTARRSSRQHSAPVLHRLYVPPSQLQTHRVEGILVTDPLRTIFDCGRAYPFRHALSLADSALRAGVNYSDMIDYCSTPRRGQRQSRALAVAQFANSLSDNGGESNARAVMIIEGIMLPQLQRPFPDLDAPGTVYRADFSWQLTDGRLIVAEFDGSRKYVDPEMTRSRTVMEVVHRERRRQQALEQAGVTIIVRLSWDDVTHPWKLVRKLTDAGVPRGPRRAYLERCTAVYLPYPPAHRSSP